MTQTLASGVTACRPLKIGRDGDGGLALFLGALPLSTGDACHVAEQSQIKGGAVGTGAGGVPSELKGRLPGSRWCCGESGHPKRADPRGAPTWPR